MADNVETIFVKTRAGFEVGRIVFSEVSDGRNEHTTVSSEWEKLGGAWIIGSEDEVSYEVADTPAVRDAINKGRLVLASAPKKAVKALEPKA